MPETTKHCKACGGTGKSSAGGTCYPCGGVRTRAVKVRHKVLHGDCRKLIPIAAKKVGGFHFAFADPPFNIGQDYTGYDDRQSWEDFQQFTFEWIKAVWDSLRPGGLMCLHGPDNMAIMYIQEGLCQGYGTHRLAWVNWHYRFGQHRDTSWIDARCHCLVYAKPGFKHTWNPDAVAVASDRAGNGDKRTDTTKRPGKRNPGTVWGIPSDGPNWGRVVGDNTERQPECPNQLPEVYLERLIRAYTNPGDFVLDPFGGSGTTATVAVALERSAVTMDVSETNVELIKRRIKKGPVRFKRTTGATP